MKYLILIILLSGCNEGKHDFIESRGEIFHRLSSLFNCQLGLLVTDDGINVYDEKNNVITCKELVLTWNEYQQIKINK